MLSNQLDMLTDENSFQLTNFRKEENPFESYFKYLFSQSMQQMNEIINLYEN